MTVGLPLIKAEMIDGVSPALSGPGLGAGVTTGPGFGARHPASGCGRPQLSFRALASACPEDAPRMARAAIGVRSQRSAVLGTETWPALTPGTLNVSAGRKGLTIV